MDLNMVLSRAQLAKVVMIMKPNCGWESAIESILEGWLASANLGCV